MTNNIDRAAKVIADALRPALAIADGIGHDLARAQDAAGVLAPNLPDPNMADGGFAMWNLAHIDISADSERQTVYVDGNELTPDQALAEAAALLAAATHATQEKK